jgi:hypothetical protein
MDREKRPVEAALDGDTLAAKRKRRFTRATEAFQKRAEGSERRWLAGLGGKPKR